MDITATATTMSTTMKENALLSTVFKTLRQHQKPIVGSVLLVGLGALSLENYMRRNNEMSLMRPSVAIDALGAHVRKGMTWVGWQLARTTDLYYLLKEYIMEDLKTLCLSVLNLGSTPFYVLKGYHDYYTQALTPLAYGIAGSGLCILGSVLVWKWTGAPVPDQIRALGGWLSQKFSLN